MSGRGRTPVPRDWWRRFVRASDGILLLATSAALAAGLALWAAGAGGAADVVWAAATVLAAVPALLWVVAALRRGRTGVDLIAALALAGTLLVGEYLAGALIALMLATGRFLDARAQRRATRDLRALLEHAPRTARIREGDQVRVQPLERVRPGDLLLIGPGEVVGVDGMVEATRSVVLDESALTGESAHVERAAGEPIRSGVLNAGGAFDLRATATAADSTYAGIVRLARQVGAETAPLVRLADRYATWFLPAALLVAGAAWAITGSAVRAVAVLVVATPCPLLLAAPVAIVSGISRASRLGVLVRDGAALESLGRARTLVMDKTGTLTAGRPAVTSIATAAEVDPARIMRLAGSLEQASPHLLAEALVREARRRDLPLSAPTEVVEQPGRGTSGVVDGHRLSVGRLGLPERLPPWAEAAAAHARLDNAALVWVVVDGDLQAAILLHDRIRADAPRTVRRLRAAGLRRIVMLTGDRGEPAREVATVLGLDGVLAEQSPAGKVASVQAEDAADVTVMVGDGVNDAPALAAARVGVAMGARGATASSEAADIVLTTDRIDRLADAMDIARHTRRIAVQSAVAGMGLSLVAMIVAAAGLLPPAPGAIVQEAIDVAVILNALRALRGRAADLPAVPADTDRMLHRFAHEHDQLRDALPAIRSAADLLSAGPSAEALERVRAVHHFLTGTLLPHERAEEHELYPALAGPLGSGEATATMSRMHAEIERLSARLGAHVEAVRDGPPDRARTEDMLACLYGLHTVLCLHFSQEEESYFALRTDDPVTR